MRRVIRIGIVGFWLVLMGMLVRQNWPAAVGKVSPVPVPTALDASDEWMGVYHSNEKIGYAHTSVRPVGHGYRFEEESLLRLTILDTPQTVRTVVHADTGKDFALQQVDFDMVNGPTAFHVEGKIDAGKLHLETRVGADESHSEIPLDGPVYLPASARQRLAAAPMRPGEHFESQVFDPSVMKEHRVVSTVHGRETVPGTLPPIQAWRIEESFGGAKTVAWMNDDGRVLREEGPMQLTLVRESRERAIKANWNTDTALDLVASAAIPVRPPLKDPQSMSSLRLRIGGIDLDQVPSDQRQCLSGDVLSIARESVPARAAYEIPYRGEPWRAEIASTPLLQSDHPRIRAVAAEAIGDERRPVEVARRLEQFVFHRLKKVPTVSVPNALQVLDMGEGDCNEHATLFAALARAVGLPARVVAGVVYLDGAFYYHAWNEVWLDRWVSVDAVLDQFPADVTHVKFAAGGPEDQLDMIGVIGRLSLQVLPAGDVPVVARTPIG